MKIDRRELLTGASAAALMAATTPVAARFPHGTLPVGGGGGGSNPNPLASQRSLLNILQYSVFYYGMIDHFKFGDQGLLPNNTYTKPWAQMIDAQGWPNSTTVGISDTASKGFNGGGIRIPSTDNYGAGAGQTYTIDWDGSCEWVLSAGVWTVVSQTNVTQVGGAGAGRFKNTNNTLSASVTVTPSGMVNAGGLPNLVAINFLSSDPGSIGKFVKNFRFYRTGDAGRLAAGKMFRLPFLQTIVDMNPSAIRFMDWLGSAVDQNCRWENRQKPDLGNYVAGDYSASPPYGNADYVLGAGTTHQYTLAAATATAGNPKVTSATPTHGEVVTTTMTSGLVGSDGVRVTNITRAATPTVTAAGHNYVNGDVIVHFIDTASGMQQLDRRKCQVSGVVAGVSYQINIDTSAFTAYSGSGAISTYYVSLKLGAWTEFPIVFPDGGTPPTLANGLGRTGLPGYIQSGQQFTFWFDKTLAPMNNSSSVPIKGAWIMRNPGGNSTFAQGSFGESIPIELCTALVLEANELSVSQGITNPIHMWLNCPFRGLISADAVWAGDYTSGSNFATNMVDVALNGSTVNGVPYRGLKAINGPSLLLESCNETWNNFGFQGSAGNGILGKDQYGGINGYTMARSVGMARDVKAAFPSETRIKFVIGAWQDNTAQTDARINNTGDASYASFKQAGWGSTPISEHDAVAVAPYLDPWGNFFTSYNNDFWDDNARYLGADNSGALILTCNASTTKTLVTTAVTGGPVVVGQTLFGAGIPDQTFVKAVGGVSPNYTLTLNNTVNVALNGKASSLIVMTANASTSSASLVITAANVPIDATTLINVNGGSAVLIGGSGIIPNQSFVIGISGTYPNYTLTLDHAISFVGGTVGVNHKPGGNYIGAADQATAITNFINVVKAGSGGSFTDTINRYCDPGNPTAGVDAGYATLAGKPIINYEGGTNWGAVPNNAGGTFLAAINQSSQWATAQMNFWNARATVSNLSMPALYAWIRGGEQGQNFQWAYASPDNYNASHVEGGALSGTAFWPALGTRNKALTI